MNERKTAAMTVRHVGMPNSVRRARHTACLVPALVGLISAATLTGPIRPASAQADARGWSYTGRLNTARAGHTSMLLPDGKVLVAGGSSQDPRAELYDPATGTWDYTGSLNTNRAGQSATLLPNGKVLVAGGSSSGQTLDSAELYDPATGTWSYTGSLNTSRSGHTATLFQNGKVLVVGGNDYSCSPHCSYTVLESSELYDPATGVWSITGSLVTGTFGIGRTDHTATLLQSGKVLVSGGLDPGDYGAFDTELYDQTTGKWSVSGRNNKEHAFGHTATLLLNGDVLITGACTQGNYCGSGSSVEVYNPATGTWSITGGLNIRRLSHTTTLLPNGKVLVAGGFLVGSLVTSELYDPDTGTWSFTDNLNTPRSHHTATLLPDGKVLIIGGFVGGSASSGILDSVELGHNFAAGATPAPRIFRAKVGTRGLGVMRLFVDGENFAAGSVILRNGKELKTNNDAFYPEATLFSPKKAGKKTRTGDHIQVRNPDGAMSEVFIFTGS